MWDPTCGFPGEGPSSSGLRPLSTNSHPFLSKARFALTRGSKEKDHLHGLSPGVSNEFIEGVLENLAAAGNSARPVAARYQTHPANVRSLLQDDASLAVQAARRGVIYQLTARPLQLRRPRPLSLPAEQKGAALAEIQRLLTVCQAIEQVPDHDADKPLRPGCALYERQPFPPGPWPWERPVPLLKLDSEVHQYNRHHARAYAQRRAMGIPARDFESGVFCVPKSDGGFRLCTDYRRLNEYSRKGKFQMEGVQQVAELIQKDDFGMLIDLKDAYLTLGLHPAHRKYCRFRSPDGKRYQWKVVSFGTSEAPKICTKMMKPLIQILKSLGIRCLIYIDDILILDQCKYRLASAMALAMELFQSEVGLQLKISKGQLYPSQTIQCLGIIWNTATMQCSIPDKRIIAIQRTAKRLLRASAVSPTVTTRDLGRFVGQVVSTTRAIRPAKRRLLYIQHALSRGVRNGGWHGQSTLSSEARAALEWWTTDAVWRGNGNDILPPIRPIQLRMRTDAATNNAGYGGVLWYGDKSFRTQGYLTAEEQKSTFINEFEFMGFTHCLWALLPQAVPDRSLWSQVHVSVELDNTTAIKYGQCAVSRSLQMSQIGALYFDERERHQLSVSLAHIAGVLNIEADEASRRQSTHIDWQLDVATLRAALRILHAEPSLDLFASAANSQCPQYYSYHHDHRALGTDCFQHRWPTEGTSYAYPPPILIGRTLQKARHESCSRLILVAPLWQAQPWWPTLLLMLRHPPLILPNETWLTTDQMGNETWPQRWPLLVCDLSGNLPLARASRQQYLQNAGGTRRTAIQNTMIGLLTSFGCGGSVPSEVLSSVLQIFCRD